MEEQSIPSLAENARVWRISLSENAQILLVIWSFWLFVVGLDLAALVQIRRSRFDPTAALLWSVWVVVAPVIGALTYFLVKPTNLDRTG